MVCTLVFLVRDSQVLLARKKRGFGKDFWNGAGGKVEANESIEQAMVRECQEEIEVTPITYTKVAVHTFDYPDKQVIAHTFLCTEWHGEPQETEEMQPAWFMIDAIPYDHMWTDDREWLPQVIRGKKLATQFSFDQKNKITKRHIEELRG